MTHGRLSSKKWILFSETASSILLRIPKRLRQIQLPCVHLQIYGFGLMYNAEKLIYYATNQGQNSNLKMYMNSIFFN